MKAIKGKILLQFATAAALLIGLFQNCGEAFIPITELGLSSLSASQSKPVELPYNVSGDMPGRNFGEQGQSEYGVRVAQVDDLTLGKVYEVRGNYALTTYGRVEVDSAKIYRVSADVMSAGGSPSRIYLGVAPLDERTKFIDAVSSNRVGIDARVIANVRNAAGDIEITTAESMSDWNNSGTAANLRAIGFYLTGDTNRLPDYVHTGENFGASTLPTDGGYSIINNNVITLNGTLPQSLLKALNQNSNVVIRNHVDSSTYLYNAAADLEISDTWQKVEGLISGAQFNNTERQFRPGTRWARIVLLANYLQDDSAILRFNNLRIEEVNPATLVIQITQALQEQTVAQGTNVTLSAVIQGPVEEYTWLKDGVAIPGETSSTLSLPNAQASQSGVYTLRARSFTTTVETTATITIVAPPVIDVAIGNPSVNELGTITLSVAASGLGLTYQWFKNDVAIAGQTTSQLAIPVATYLDAALYRIDITNLGGTVSSQGNLAVLLLAAGDQLYARDCAGCHGPLTNSNRYNRSFDQIKTAMMTVPVMQNRFLTNNQVNRTDAQINFIATALILDPPAIATQPVANRTVAVGSNTSLSVTATGSLLSYQWFRNNVAINGANNSILPLNNVQVGNSGVYTVTVSNPAGSVTSSPSNLVVQAQPPVIVSQPTGGSFPVGANFTLSVAANSNPAATYQWRRNNTNIAGATASTYTLTNMQTNNTGNYTVVVTNPSGSVTSLAATITVVSPPNISLGVNVSNRVARATFTITGTGVTTRCGIDGGALTACSSGVTYGPYPNGTRTFRIQATDSVGQITTVDRAFEVASSPGSHCGLALTARSAVINGGAVGAVQNYIRSCMGFNPAVSCPPGFVQRSFYFEDFGSGGRYSTCVNSSAAIPSTANGPQACGYYTRLNNGTSIPLGINSASCGGLNPQNNCPSGFTRIGPWYFEDGGFGQQGICIGPDSSTANFVAGEHCGQYVDSATAGIQSVTCRGSNPNVSCPSGFTQVKWFFEDGHAGIRAFCIKD